MRRNARGAMANYSLLKRTCMLCDIDVCLFSFFFQAPTLQQVRTPQAHSTGWTCWNTTARACTPKLMLRSASQRFEAWTLQTPRATSPLKRRSGSYRFRRNALGSQGPLEELFKDLPDWVLQIRSRGHV